MNTDWTLYGAIIAAAVIIVFVLRVVRAKIEDDPGMKYTPHPDDDRLPNYERDGYQLEDNQKIRYEHSVEADGNFYHKLEALAIGQYVTLTFAILVEAEEEEEPIVEEQPKDEELEILEATTDNKGIEDLEDVVGNTEENEPELDEALLEAEPGDETPEPDKTPEFVIENMDVVNLDVEVLAFDGEMIQGKLTESADSSEVLKAGFEIWFHRNHVLLFAEQ